MSFTILFAHHLTAPGLAIGFALALVGLLVTAEERDLRRGGTTGTARSRA